LSAIFEIVEVPFCCEPLLRLGFRAPELDELRELDRDPLLPERELERVLRELALRELEVFVWAISASLLRRRLAVPNPVPHHQYPAYCG
jgi:hypothetical protein